MSLRAALLLGALLLPGCLDYKIAVEVTVASDGTVHRVVRIRERSDPPKTWKRFRPPAKPYFVTGSEKRCSMGFLSGQIIDVLGYGG